MADPTDFSTRQRTLLLRLACLPPGRWAPAFDHVSTLRSLQRRGLIEQRRSDGQIRLAHNSAGNADARNGGTTV